MKKTVLILIAILLIKTDNSQPKAVTTTHVDGLWLRELFCIDSAGNKTTQCSMDLDGFQVEFTKAIFDKSTNKLRLTGRLNPPIADVGVYLSQTDVLQLSNALGYTRSNPNNWKKGGYFDVSFTVKPNESLFFYDPSWFARQFEIYKLLTK